MIVHMIGNAHLDPVWLWPWQTGADEALATMSSAADRCDEYPEFIFTRGEAWLYQQVARIRPDLFARVRKLVERGQWHITGGQFIQPDLNLTTEAGLRRQIAHGQRYFRETFGVAPTVGYNVDSFGHTATLPDILAENGYTGYVFRRPEQNQVKLPANTFIWRGVHGGEVVAFRIEPHYIAHSTDLTGQIEIAIESADPALGHVMCFYGIGNHGGGPTKAMIEWIIAHKNSFPDHELVFSTPQAYMDAIADKRHLLPTVSTELQHTFPGCYSVMHDVKKAQRHGEHLLCHAEDAAKAFAPDDATRADYVTRLETAWEDLLLTEFHDIVTGTSIPSAWDSVRAIQGRARIVGETVLYEATRRWSYATLGKTNEQQIAIINADAAPFDGYVEAEPFLDFDTWRNRWIADETGAPIAFQRIQPESSQMIERVLFRADVGAQTGRRFILRSDAPPAQPRTNALKASPDGLASSDVDVTLGGGGITQIAYKGRNLLAGKGIGLHLREDTTDTWTFHTDRWEEPVRAQLADAAWKVEEDGPLRVRARLDARLGNSRIQWTVSLCHDEPRLALELTVNFDERFTLLQMPMQLSQQPSRWTDGLAAGQIDRAPSAAEWPFLGWSRMRVGETDIGLVTSDFFSHSLDGAQWEPTLLRSPKMAWGGGEPVIYHGRDYHSDQGVHHFAWDLWFADLLGDAEFDLRVRQQARPPVIFDRYEGMNRPAWGAVPPRGHWGPAMMRNLAEGRVEDPGEDEAGGLFERSGEDYRG